MTTCSILQNLAHKDVTFREISILDVAEPCGWNYQSAGQPIKGSKFGAF